MMRLREAEQDFAEGDIVCGGDAGAKADRARRRWNVSAACVPELVRVARML